MRILSFLRSKSSDSSERTLARTMALWCSAISICASTDLLSQPLAILSFYTCSAQMGRTSTVFGALCQSVCMMRSAAFLLLGLFSATAQMRPPAVPLVAHDPYFSIWSMADRLNGEGTKHWTGKPNTLTAYARIDGKSYRIMGRDRQAGNELAQTRLEVLPTRTIYEFAGAGMTVGLTFFTPALPDDLDVLSRPLTYLQWSAASSDGREHEVEIYFDAASDLVVNTPDQPVLAARYQLDGLPLLRMGSREQPVLAKRGDDLRIDWGYLYLAADKAEGVTAFAGDRPQARAAFDASGRLPDSDELGEVRRGGPVLAYAIGVAPRGRWRVCARVWGGGARGRGRARACRAGQGKGAPGPPPPWRTAIA